MNEIIGWDSYYPIYKSFIQDNDDAKILEVGVFLGKTIIRAAQYAKSLNKNISFYAVDLWDEGKEDEHKKIIKELGGPVEFYNQFCDNVVRAGVQDIIYPIRGNSVEISRIFEDNSIDMVFLDGSHKYDDVKEDILAWKNKTKKWFCGHDVDCPDVIRAVEELIGKNYNRLNDSWVFRRDW